MGLETVRICQNNYSWQSRLNPDGTIIGRSHECDIVIDSKHVSRHHARIYSSSDGQWYVEDLGSSNGTFVNGERVESHPISRTDVIEIGMASLSFSPLVEQATVPCIEEPNIIIEDYGTEVFYDKPRLEDCEQQPCPEKLKQAIQRLSKISNSDEVYPELCRLLAQEPKTAAAIFRVPNAAVDTPQTPTIMACCFGSKPGDTGAELCSGSSPSHLVFRVSHRLLEAVRKGGRPLMTKSIFSCDTQVTVSLIDEFSPRALICASLGASENTVDLLYVDVPIIERHKPSEEEVFAFVQAVARLVSQNYSAR